MKHALQSFVPKKGQQEPIVSVGLILIAENHLPEIGEPLVLTQMSRLDLVQLTLFDFYPFPRNRSQLGAKLLTVLGLALHTNHAGLVGFTEPVQIEFLYYAYSGYRCRGCRTISVTIERVVRYWQESVIKKNIKNEKKNSIAISFKILMYDYNYLAILRIK